MSARDTQDRAQSRAQTHEREHSRGHRHTRESTVEGHTRQRRQRAQNTEPTHQDAVCVCVPGRVRASKTHYFRRGNGAVIKVEVYVIDAVSNKVLAVVRLCLVQPAYVSIRQRTLVLMSCLPRSGYNTFTQYIITRTSLIYHYAHNPPQANAALYS